MVSNIGRLCCINLHVVISGGIYLSGVLHFLQVAAAVAHDDGELWSPTGTSDGHQVEGHDGGNVVVYQDPLAEAMASINAPSSSPSPSELLPADLQSVSVASSVATSSGLFGHNTLEEVQYEQQQQQLEHQQLVSSSHQLALPYFAL